jgi:hypothetical protein
MVRVKLNLGKLSVLPWNRKKRGEACVKKIATATSLLWLFFNVLQALAGASPKFLTDSDGDGYFLQDCLERLCNICKEHKLFET